MNNKLLATLLIASKVAFAAGPDDFTFACCELMEHDGEVEGASGLLILAQNNKAASKIIHVRGSLDKEEGVANDCRNLSLTSETGGAGDVLHEFTTNVCFD